MTKLINGDCLVELKSLEDCSVDAIVSDPPYELGFMGKKWDASGIAYNVELWRECLRVLKPGGHLLAFGGTRTYHRMACAIEDAGFEVRDMLEWIYASGFPKSLNVGKAVDKLQGNEREDVEVDIAFADSDCWGVPNNNSKGNNIGFQTTNEKERKDIIGKGKRIITKGTSAWEGFGTALKPAHEPIVMARKPLSEKTIVENVLKHGTGAIDIDGCRIPTSQHDIDLLEAKSSKNPTGKKAENVPFVEGIASKPHEQGRFPANIICTDDALNDGVMTKSGSITKDIIQNNPIKFNASSSGVSTARHNGDTGSKSRYFDIDVWGEKHGLLQYPKASKRERNEGCEGLEFETKIFRPGEGLGGQQIPATKQNHHPTVKPTHLMAWLVRLVSKEGDTVLDPFMGSGTTGVSATKLNRNFIGIELDKDYFEIAQKRIQNV